MRIVNALIFVFAAGAVIQSWALFARNRTGLRATLFWSLIWMAIGVFGLFPRFLDFFMASVQMQSRMIFLFTVSILILYAVFFRQSTENMLVRSRLNLLAQEVALLRYRAEYVTANRGDGDAGKPAPPPREGNPPEKDRSAIGD